MRTTFHAAGVHQHVRVLDAAARGGVVERAQPAVARLLARQARGLLADCSVERRANVIDRTAAAWILQGALDRLRDQAGR